MNANNSNIGWPLDLIPVEDSASDRELAMIDLKRQVNPLSRELGWAPAMRSASARAKAASHVLLDGTPVHSYATVMAELATLVRNTCRTPSAGADAPTFEITTTANPKHQHALALIQTIRP